MAQKKAIPEVIRSCYNGTGSDIAANVFVKHASGANKNVSLPAGDTDPILGVTMAKIKNGQWGDVQIRGIALVKAAGAVTAKARVTTNNAGKAVDWTAAGGRSVGGTSYDTGTNLDDLLEVELAGPDTFGIS
jgi:hypothetical protein